VGIKVSRVNAWVDTPWRGQWGEVFDELFCVCETLRMLCITRCGLWQHGLAKVMQSIHNSHKKSQILSQNFH
jgi:hypothetical protein